ncbi:MAG: FeoA family protein [Anaerolineales bacterium]|nr:FeoA family protein [Anaerolineales bacterium]
MSSLKPGERGVVVGPSGGRGLMCRMVSLGFTSGVEVTVVQNFGRGPMIVTVRDTQIALGRGEALKVLVEAL